jgi:thiol-disulfide isomerase/thioredoxin
LFFQTLSKLMKPGGKPMMLMAYAPWCKFCKIMKPDYAGAATELKDFAVMAAMDVTRPENSIVSKFLNVTGFPTLFYFECVLLNTNRSLLWHVERVLNGPDDFFPRQKRRSEATVRGREQEGLARGLHAQSRRPTAQTCRGGVGRRFERRGSSRGSGL